MSLKNLNAKKIPKILKNKIFNNRIKFLYNKFEKRFDIKESFVVAVSGGPDSLALAFLTKLYSIKNKLFCKYIIVDHKLRKNSTEEAHQVKKILNKLSISSEILTWKGKKPKKNIQSLARKKRYDLLFARCNELNIKNLIIGHHSNDMIENFFIRMVRGSGLKGLVSLGEITKINQINLIRPLLKFNKKDLLFISTKVFDFYIQDTSNDDIKYTRIRVRKLISELEKNGLDTKKLSLTIKNLKKSDRAVTYYVEQNKKTNSYYNKEENRLLINENFFNQPYEIVFRSLSDSIKLIGKKYNPVRGKKIDNILFKIEQNVLFKETLGGCLIKKVNRTIILTKEG